MQRYKSAALQKPADEQQKMTAIVYTRYAAPKKAPCIAMSPTQNLARMINDQPRLLCKLHIADPDPA